MAIDLKSIRRGPRLSPPRIIMYGPHGVGKTTFGASGPNPILLPIDGEDGKGLLDIPDFPLLKSYGEVIEAIGTLYDGGHDFETAIFDSLDWLEPLIWRETCQRNGWTDIESPGYGKGYVAADDVWREYLSGLSALRDVKGMAIVLLAHCEITKFNDPNNEPYDRYGIKLHKRANALVQEWAEAVFFANYKVHTEKSDAGFNKKVVRGAGFGERVIYTEERPAHLAKNRWDLPPEMPFPKVGAFQTIVDHMVGKSQKSEAA